MKLPESRFLAVRILATLGLTLFFAAVSPLLSAQPTPTPTSEILMTLDPAQSTVRWSVDSTLHTVHGTFALKNGTVHFDPETGKAGGEIAVSALSGESGNSARDKRMHKEILETEKFPVVVFHPAQIDGKVGPSGASDVKLSGVFTIHGADHNLTALVHAELAGHHWTATAKFEVPFVQWGIKDPSNFLLRVKPVVNVELEMSGDIKTAK